MRNFEAVESGSIEEIDKNSSRVGLASHIRLKRGPQKILPQSPVDVNEWYRIRLELIEFYFGLDSNPSNIERISEVFSEETTVDLPSITLAGKPQVVYYFTRKAKRRAIGKNKIRPTDYAIDFLADRAIVKWEEETNSCLNLLCCKKGQGYVIFEFDGRALNEVLIKSIRIDY